MTPKRSLTSISNTATKQNRSFNISLLQRTWFMAAFYSALNCYSILSCKICKSALMNHLVTNPYSWTLPQWRVQFAYLILHLLFSDGKLVIMIQAWPAALLASECDLPLAHGSQWNINPASDQGASRFIKHRRMVAYGLVQAWQLFEHDFTFFGV